MAGAGLRIVFDEPGDVLDVVLADLGVLLERFETLTPLMDDIGQYGVTSTKERFTTNVDPSGDPWVPSERYELLGGYIQVASGRLRDSQTHNVLGEDGVEWGTNLIYGAQRQFGGTIRAKYAPALRFRGPLGDWRTAQEVFQPPRPYLGISEADEAEISEIAGRYLDGAFE